MGLFSMFQFFLRTLRILLGHMDFAISSFLSFSVSYLLLFVMICACMVVVNVSWLSSVSVWSCMGIQFVLVCYVAGTIEGSF
jgi:hypothetical protein